MIKLGNKVKDSITGFTGIATTRTEYLYGCVHIGITPESLSKESQPIDTHYFDEQRIVTLKEKAIPVSKDSAATSGGPTPGPAGRFEHE